MKKRYLIFLILFSRLHGNGALKELEENIGQLIDLLQLVKNELPPSNGSEFAKKLKEKAQQIASMTSEEKEERAKKIAEEQKIKEEEKAKKVAQLEMQLKKVEKELGEIKNKIYKEEYGNEAEEFMKNFKQNNLGDDFLREIISSIAAEIFYAKDLNEKELLMQSSFEEVTKNFKNWKAKKQLKTKIAVDPESIIKEFISKNPIFGHYKPIVFYSIYKDIYGKNLYKKPPEWVTNTIDTMELDVNKKIDEKFSEQAKDKVKEKELIEQELRNVGIEPETITGHAPTAKEFEESEAFKRAQEEKARREQEEPEGEPEEEWED